MNTDDFLFLCYKYYFYPKLDIIQFVRNVTRVNMQVKFLKSVKKRLSYDYFRPGAAVSVMSDDLYFRMNPQPDLEDIGFKVSEANKKPLHILGKAPLKVKV